MGDQPPAPIIIRKKLPVDDKAKAGAWKIALADMMTAMMAFFLVLWLISSSDTETLKGIADHFKVPKIAVNRITSGTDGVFEGQTNPLSGITKDGGNSQNTELDLMNKSEASVDSDRLLTNSIPNEITKSLEMDQEHFQKLELEISERISSDPELSLLKDQVQFIREKEGLRIQIIDEVDSPMFDLGTSTLLPKPSRFIREISPMIMKIPNKIIVRGHTDSHKYANDGSRNNWILSMERAEATRKLLEASGIDRGRFVKVVGVADVDPYISKDLYDARNRRINIILKYMDE